MNTYVTASDEPADSKKRTQKFLRFQSVPGDETLIEQLPAAQREILKTPGPYGEIAQRLGLPIGTVRSRLHRARAALERLREKSQGDQSPPDPEFH